MRTPKAHSLCELIYTVMWEDVSPHEIFLLPLMLYILYILVVCLSTNGERVLNYTIVK